MKITHIDTLYLLPTNKKSHAKTVYLVNREDNNIFGNPVILMSDIHSHTQQVIDYLKEQYDLSKYTVITVGDMSGTDDLSTQYYQQLADLAHNFYFVQGNHDMPDKNKVCNTLKNRDSTNCMVDLDVNIDVQKTDIGKIGGVNGIICTKSKNHPYKLESSLFLKKLLKLKDKVDVLLLHDTPKHSENVIGNKDLWNSVKVVKPNICVYGHCHHKEVYYFVNNIHLFNVDSRIVIFE